MASETGGFYNDWRTEDFLSLGRPTQSSRRDPSLQSEPKRQLHCRTESANPATSVPPSTPLAHGLEVTTKAACVQRVAVGEAGARRLKCLMRHVPAGRAHGPSQTAIDQGRSRDRRPGLRENDTMQNRLTGVVGGVGGVRAAGRIPLSASREELHAEPKQGRFHDAGH
jgi:hypothetical protein